MVARPLVAWLVQELHVHEKNVISVLAKVKLFFPVFLSYVCITQLCAKCYDFGVKARFQSQKHNT